MTGPERPSEPLTEALAGFGAELVEDVVEEAQADAVARARSILSDAMTRSLLEQAVEHLQDASDERVAGEVTRLGEVQGRDDEEGEAVYVYGVAWAGEGADGAAGEEGVAGGNPPHRLEHMDLAAITSIVPLAEFGEEGLHENLNDVVWLEQVARRHEAVLAAARREATVVPLRLCTIYRDEDHVREMLEREHPVFASALERLRGKTEWGVKVIAEPGAFERAVAGHDADEAGRVSPGLAYIEGKQRKAKAREDAERIADEWAESVHARASALAREALLNPVQSREASGYEGEMLLNGVYLVDDDNADEFSRLVDELEEEYRSHGVSVELTGPWPPYNFVKGSIEAAR